MLGPLGKSEQRKSIDDTLDSKRHSVITKKNMFLMRNMYVYNNVLYGLYNSRKILYTRKSKYEQHSINSIGIS